MSRIQGKKVAGRYAPETASAPPGPEPTDRIRARAFEIYLHRNGAGGDAVSDWLQAERELATTCTCPPHKSVGTLPEEANEARGEMLLRSGN